MTTVAVVGAAGFRGAAIVARLSADRDVERILGVDVAEPQMPSPKLEFFQRSPGDPHLAEALAGADAVVSLALAPESDASPPRGRLRDADLAGAFALRNVLDAVAATGARRLVHVSSATVYGARADNPVPLDETAPLRANADFGWAYQHLLAEELVSDWARRHPTVAVTVLRPATTLGWGAQGPVTRHLESPRLPLVRGYEPPAQLLHVEDLAAAVHLACNSEISGAYNVAADGWLSVRELVALTGRRPLDLPEGLAFLAARLLWARGLVNGPPGALHYLMHPWVVSSERLRDRGWNPAHSNRDIIREFVAEHSGYLSIGRRRLRKPGMTVASAAVAVGLATALVVRRRATRARH